MNIIYVLVAVIAVVFLWFVMTYNSFIRARLRAKEALSDIGVQSKRRFDLIPNLIETVKGYMSHERGVLENVTAARSKLTQGGTPLDKAAAENNLSATLKTLFAVSEAYPDLKANVNFLELQREFSDTENKMMAARRFYNSVVNDLNAKVASFPSNLVAKIFGFTAEKFFELTDAKESAPVNVKF